MSLEYFALADGEVDSSEDLGAVNGNVQILDNEVRHCGGLLGAWGTTGIVVNIWVQRGARAIRARERVP